MPLTNLGNTGAAATTAATPTLSLSAPPPTAEGNATGNSVAYTLTLNRRGATGPVGYGWSVAGSGASPASGNDFAGGVYPSGNGTFAIGETSKTITVAFAGDTVFEPDEGFTVSVTASLALTPVSATGTILNDDAAPPPVLLMGSRFNQPGFGGYAGSDGTDTDSNSRIGSFNETGTGVTRLRAYFANWMANPTNEQDGYSVITVAAAVEYPAGTFTPLAFAGGGTVSIPASGAASLAESDEMTLTTPIPAGAQYWVRTFVSVAAGGKWVQGYLIQTAFGEAVDFSTAASKTTGGTITNAAASATRRGYGPAAVKATGFTGTPVGKAFAVVGDSLLMGSGDAVDTTVANGGKGNIGYFAKACSGNYPVVNVALAGTQGANNQPANFTRRAALLAKIGITHVFCDYSINDTSAGRTAAQQTSDMSSIAAGFKSAVPGVKVVWATQCPRTSGTYLTAAGQTSFATPSGAFTGGASSVRAQVNASLRAGISGIDTVFDATALVEVGAGNQLALAGGLWVSGNGGTGYATPFLTTTGAPTDQAANDGLHPYGAYTNGPYGGVYMLRAGVRAVFAGW